MASDAGSGRPGDHKPNGAGSEHHRRPEPGTGEGREPNVRDRVVDRLAGDSDAARARSYADRVADLGLQTDLRKSGREYLEAVHYHGRDAGGDTRRNRDEGYRAAAVQAEYQRLPDLADEAIARISPDGIRTGIRTQALIDTASQAALLQDPDRVVELIDRIPDAADRDAAWDRIADLSGAGRSDPAGPHPAL